MTNQNMLFTLPGTSGEMFDAAAHLPLVVYFYPKDNTPGCTLEAVEFSALYAAFRAVGVEVVGISRDSVTTHRNFCNKHHLSVPLLSDADGKVCRLFDVIKQKILYGKEVMGIERSTFVLDKEGNIVQQWCKVKAAGHAQEVLAFVQTL